MPTAQDLPVDNAAVSAGDGLDRLDLDSLRLTDLSLRVLLGGVNPRAGVGRLRLELALPIVRAGTTYCGDHAHSVGVDRGDLTRDSPRERRRLLRAEP